MSTEFGLFDQQDAQARLGAALLGLMPEGAVSIALTASVLLPTRFYTVSALRADGTQESIRVRNRLDGTLLDRVREVMYREDAGTWFSMVMEVDPAGSVRARFDYDDEGEWGLGGVDPIAYVTDQRRYPRSVDNQPEWLREKLADGERRLAARGE